MDTDSEIGTSNTSSNPMLVCCIYFLRNTLENGLNESLSATLRLNNMTDGAP